MATSLNVAKQRVAKMVARAQSGCKETENELLMLVEKLKNNIVTRMGRRHYLTDMDIEDAQQEGVFWILEAIQHYDTRQARSGSSFFTFLFRVIGFRFQDFVRRRRRVERREPLASGLMDILLLASGQRADRGAVRERRIQSDDPAYIAESRETTDRLNQALSQLDAHSIRLWRLLASGMRLRPIATQLGISYEAAKRRRRRLLVDLKTHLEERPRDESR